MGGYITAGNDLVPNIALCYADVAEYFSAVETESALARALLKWLESHGSM